MRGFSSLKAHDRSCGANPHDCAEKAPQNAKRQLYSRCYQGQASETRVESRRCIRRRVRRGGVLSAGAECARPRIRAHPSVSSRLSLQPAYSVAPRAFPPEAVCVLPRPSIVCAVWAAAPQQAEACLEAPELAPQQLEQFHTEPMSLCPTSDI